MMKISGIQNPQVRFVSPQKNPSSHGIVASYNNSISFGNDDGQEEAKKKGFSVKKLTNVLGTVAGLGIIGASAIYMAKRPKWMKLDNKAKKLETKIKAEKTKYNDAIEISEGKQKKGNWLYRLGYKTNALVDKIGSEELANNLLYGIGTVIVMPLVILFSPFGKKNSSKEDKKYAVMRQPLSFATMFSIQLTNDKVFKRWSKAVVDQNFMETDKVQKALKAGKADTVIDEIKYNADVLKKHFLDNCKHLLSPNEASKKNNLQPEETDVLFKMKDPKLQRQKLEEYLRDTTKRSVSEENVKKLLKDFDRYAQAAGRNKLVTESLKIASNVIVSQFIGCTLLNVIYGKTMKHIRQTNEQKLNDKEIQAKVEALYEAKKAEGSVA